ncbi:MAG: hypothetical protein V7607_365 [Solirubrobacteraceae bacterium]
MTDDGHQESALDWSSASVDDDRLTVPVIGDVPTGWTKRVERVAERLGRPGSSWGAIKVTKKELRVEGVAPGSERDLHHFLESVVLQANTDLRDDDDEDGPDDERSERDQEMTEAFRALAIDRRDGEDDDD